MGADRPAGAVHREDEAAEGTACVPLSPEEERLEELEDLADIARVREEIAREGTIQLDQVKRELGLT